MNYHSHLLTTFFLGIAVLYFAGYTLASLDAFAWLGLAMFASLIPDLDSKDSKLNQFARPAIFILGAIVFYLILTPTNFTTEPIRILASLGGGYIILVAFERFVGPHRGFLHSLAFSILLAALVWNFGGLFPATAVVFGVVAHLFGDAVCDKTGVGR